MTDLPPKRRLALPRPYTASADGHRVVRSFVLRQGRVSNAQARAVEDLLPRYGIPFQSTPLDLAAVFGAGRPVVLEIGFGTGETSALIARSRPETGFLGLEVHTPGVGNLLQILAREDISNLRIVQHDAVEVLEAMIAPASLTGVHIFFPDPWPKKRHHKRRLVQPPLVERIASRLVSGGYLHLATDVDDYAGQMHDVAAASGWFTAFTAQESAAHPARPATRFEHRGVRLGHQIYDLLFRKVDPPPD